MKLIVQGIRFIFITLDWAVYSLIEAVFQLIIDLANVEIFSDTVINDFARRLYIILGLVMVFKLMISFIQIIVNPDKMDDKEKGVGSILKRFVISLALIVMVPSIFDLARQVQNYIIPIIPKVIMGVTTAPSSTDEDTSEMMEKTGRTMALYSFLPFFNYDNPSCNDGSILGTTPEEDGLTNVALIYSVASARDNVNETDGCSTNKYDFKYSYRMGISTAVGVYLLISLINVAIYIAIRAIKLAICEFIAPIPIASYIDPKTSKQAFDNWVHTSVSTYLDLFINLISVYFVCFVFLTVFNKDTLTTIYAKLGGSTSRGLFVTLFIIIGLIKFLKEAPKFISNMLGIKEGGSIMAMFKGAGSMFATAVGAGVGAAGNMYNARKSGNSWGSALKSGVAGYGSGLFHGTKGSLSGKSAKEVWNSTTQGVWARRNQRAAELAAGVKPSDRRRVAMQDYLQISDELSLAEGRQKAIGTVRDDITNIKSVLQKRIKEKEMDIGFRRDGSSKTLQRIEQIIQDNRADIMQKGNQSLINFVQSKFDATTGKLKKNASLSVSEFENFASLAEDENLHVGKVLRDNRFVDSMYKELINNAARSEAVDGMGNIHESFNREGTKVHPDIVGAFNKLDQDIQANVADLGKLELTNGDIYDTADKYQAAAHSSLLDLDTELQNEGNKISSKVAMNVDAAARSANAKRKENNKK